MSIFSKMRGGVIRLVESQFFKLKLRRASAHERAELMRDKFYYLGKNVELYTINFGTEPYLVSIHDNVIVAAGVNFVNHDVSVFNVARLLGLRRGDIDKVGSIELFENCFIGTSTILMPNSSVGKNSVIAAGSIVTKHVPDNEVWGGIPAKFIMTIAEYAKRLQGKSSEFPWMPLEKKNKMSESELIRTRQKYFFEDLKRK